MIQIEEPAIHSAAAYGAPAEYLDFLVDLFNHTVEGLDDAEVWVHTCWGNPGAQHCFDPQISYEPSVDIYLNRLNGDVWTIESKESNHSLLPAFAPYKGNLPKKVAVGMISHRRLQVETPEDVAADIRTALEYIDADKLVLSSDCGFGRQGVPRPIAMYKAAALAQGANIVRGRARCRADTRPGCRPGASGRRPGPRGRGGRGLEAAFGLRAVEHRCWHRNLRRPPLGQSARKDVENGRPRRAELKRRMAGRLELDGGPTVDSGHELQRARLLERDRSLRVSRGGDQPAVRHYDLDDPEAMPAGGGCVLSVGPPRRPPPERDLSGHEDAEHRLVGESRGDVRGERERRELGVRELAGLEREVDLVDGQLGAAGERPRPLLGPDVPLVVVGPRHLAHPGGR